MPLVSAHGHWSDRESLVLRQDDEDGNTAFGEVCPTPGFTRFTLEQARAEADQWVRYGGEADDFRFIGSALGCIRSGIWKEPREKSVLPPIARMHQAEDGQESATIKRKIGTQSINEEIPIVLDWLSRLSAKQRVRLDANESLSRKQLMRWVKALHEEKRIEFIEQPTSRPDDEWLLRFAVESPVPLALDESISRMGGIKKLLFLEGSLFYVIKPSLFSDWTSILSLIQKKPDRVVLSTVYESPFGYEALIRLACRSKVSAGLERSFFRDNTYEFTEHHSFPLLSPSVTNLQIKQLWDVLQK